MNLTAEHIDTIRWAYKNPDIDALADMAKRTRAVQDALAEREKDLAKADEHNGRLLRENEDLKDTVSRRKRWLESAKKEWGVGNNVSFDIIWKEALELKRDALRSRS